MQREALVNYQRVIYTAFRDVADSLAEYTKTSQQRTEQERLVEALRASSQLSTERYQGGLDSYLPVLDAQRNLFQGELDLARLRAARACVDRPAVSGARRRMVAVVDSTERRQLTRKRRRTAAQRTRRTWLSG